MHSLPWLVTNGGRSRAEILETSSRCGSPELTRAHNVPGAHVAARLPNSHRSDGSSADRLGGWRRQRENTGASRRAENGAPWRKWGPYLSERQWGTVREDYSADGDAWNYFTHDQARSRAYRWGEDGLAGFCDDEQRLCFALALWNGNDPILKERLFGLTNGEGNHGEDVKEYYFYLDGTPTHSYMRMLYKYPQARLPVRRSGRRNRGARPHDLEYELLDTGVFDDDRYFDVSSSTRRPRPRTS